MGCGNASEGIVPRTIPVLLLGDMVSITVLWKFEESVGLVVIGVGISVGVKHTLLVMERLAGGYLIAPLWPRAFLFSSVVIGMSWLLWESDCLHN